MGGADADYDRAARNVDWLLAERIPAWLAAGYRVIVTADHGMGEDRSHGGTDAAERRVPCFCFGEGMNGLAVTEEPVKQRYLAAFFARTLGLTPALTMADGAEHIKFAPVCG